MDKINEPIHSGNITKISYEAITGLKIEDAKIPTVMELKGALFKKFYDELKNPETTTKRRKSVRKNIKKLGKIFAEKPKHHSFIPVYIEKISNEHGFETYKEFALDKQTSKNYVKLLATEHVEELKQKGLCEFAIKRMEKGLFPFNEQGKPYDLNFDHTMERFYSGRVSTTKSVDPNAPEQQGEVLEINFTNNLRLLNGNTEEDIKNDLNRLQRIKDLETGASGWVMMSIRDEIIGASNLIDLPENDETQKAYTIDINPKFAKVEINSVNYLTKVLNEAVGIETDLETFETEESLNVSDVFNEAVVGQKSFNKILTGVKDLNTQLRFAFDKVKEIDEQPVTKKKEKRAKQEVCDALAEVVNNLTFKHIAENYKKTPVVPVWSLAHAIKGIKEWFDEKAAPTVEVEVKTETVVEQVEEQQATRKTAFTMKPS